MTQIGECKLCLSKKDLQDSHFLPASINKICRDAATGQNPIALSVGVAKHTTDQISAYVFCSECEKLLNGKGEAWTHLNMARPEGFLIRDALEKVAPALATDHFAVYAGAGVRGIDIDQLSYFGMSIFWRAAVLRWPALNEGEPRMNRLWFDKYEEPIRLFLLTGAPVPPAISLLISVWPHKNPLPPIAFHTPVGKRNQGWYSYSFYIPGLDFKLAIGREIPPVLRQMSAFALPERYIYSSVAAATEMMQSFGKVVHKSVAIGKLATEYQQEMKLCEGSRCQVTKKNFPFSAKTCLTR